VLRSQEEEFVLHWDKGKCVAVELWNDDKEAEMDCVSRLFSDMAESFKLKSFKHTDSEKDPSEVAC